MNQSVVDKLIVWSLDELHDSTHLNVYQSTYTLFYLRVDKMSMYFMLGKIEMSTLLSICQQLLKWASFDMLWWLVHLHSGIKFYETQLHHFEIYDL